MTIPFQLAIGLLSIMGAALFFAAGFMLARARFSGIQESERPADGDSESVEVWLCEFQPEGMAMETTGDEQMGALHASAYQSIQAERDQAKLEVTRLRKVAAILFAQKKKLVHRQKILLHHLKKHVAASGAGQDASAALRAENEKLSGELEDTRARVQELDSAIKSMKGIGKARQDLENKIAELTEQLAVQAHEASESEQAAEQQVHEMAQKLKKMEDIEIRNQDLLIKIEIMEEQLSEVEGLRKESRALKARAGLADELADEIKTLKSENNRLHSMKIIMGEPPEPLMQFTREGLGLKFQNIVNRLSEPDTSRGVALADELGLMVAGTGDHAEAMAGMGAVFSEINDRLETFLPFGGIDLLKIVNDHGLTLMLRPLWVSGNELILSTLTKGEGPDKEAIHRLVAEVATDA